jgi:hypothetical protein
MRLFFDRLTPLKNLCESKLEREDKGLVRKTEATGEWQD